MRHEDIPTLHIHTGRYFAVIAVSVGKLQRHRGIVGTTKMTASTGIGYHGCQDTKTSFTGAARRKVHFAIINFLSLIFVFMS